MGGRERRGEAKVGVDWYRMGRVNVPCVHSVFSFQLLVRDAIYDLTNAIASYPVSIFIPAFDNFPLSVSTDLTPTTNCSAQYSSSSTSPRPSLCFAADGLPRQQFSYGDGSTQSDEVPPIVLLLSSHGASTAYNI